MVVHCAGDVSFDPPIDQAFTTNVLGTKALLDRMLEAVTDADEPAKVPHYVHISTAYTAGRRRGAIPEAPHEHTVDYRIETEAGLRMREQIEAESRTPDRLAAAQAGRTGAPAGRLPGHRGRHRAAPARMGRGRAGQGGHRRARSLGWTDVIHVHQGPGRAGWSRPAGDPISIVRPAIVESSWKHPYPGWIEGFKMAEPLILAYGRGELPEFPASPDSVVDIVPATRGQRDRRGVRNHAGAGGPAYYHVSSGARNP